MPTVSLSQAIGVAAQHVRDGRLDQGQALCEKILAKYPNEHRVLHLMGLIAHRRGQHAAALELMNRSSTLAGDVPDYRCNRATVLLAMKRPQDALAELEFAQRLLPDNPEVLYNLGLARGALKQWDEAVTALRRHVELRPNSAAGLALLGEALRKTKQYAKAIDALQAATRLEPQNAATWISLGHALFETGHVEASIYDFIRAIELAPDNVEGHLGLAMALRDRGELETELAYYRRAIELNPADVSAHSALLVMFNFVPGVTHQELAREHALWNQRHAEPLAGEIRPHDNLKDPSRPLRVGFVSPDFLDHSVRFFLLPVLETIDRTNFQIHCYSNTDQSDHITRRIQSLSDGWHEIVQIPDHDLSEQIREQQIDILIDLSMHSSNNRALFFARKPAPVQAAWLAYPGTTGLTAMDYRLTDRFQDPEGQDESWSSERPMRLPDCWCCFGPGDERPPVQSPPVQKTGSITFGSLNAFRKINQPVLALWAQILRQMPDSTLMLVCPEGSPQAKVLEFMQLQGVSPSRIRLVPELSRDEYFRRYNQIDIALDPFPFNGMTTTCDTLWMGVPVITMPGVLPAGRVGSGLLTCVGLSDLVATDAEDYVKKACALAGDVSRLVELRQTMRDRMQASPLMDAQRFTRNFENALRSMWRAWCG